MPSVPHLAKEIARGVSEEELCREVGISQDTLDLIKCSDMFKAIVYDERARIANADAS